MQHGEGQQRMRCQNMKSGLQVLKDKWAHSGDDMKNSVKVMTKRTAHTSNDMRHRIEAWWRSCSKTFGLMTENSWNHVCELGQSKAISITCIWHVDLRLHVTAKWKQSVLREVFDPRVPSGHKRREMMAIAGILPVATWLAKIKQRLDVSCRLCKRAREQRGTSTENLPEETYGHINSAFCGRMATTVAAAHHFIWRHLYASM